MGVLTLPLVVGLAGAQAAGESQLPRLREALQQELQPLEAASAGMPRVLLTPESNLAERMAAELARSRGWQVITGTAESNCRHAHVMLVLWDEHRTPGCDASRVVEACTAGLPPPEGEILAIAETIPVIELPGPRKRPAPHLKSVREFASFNRALQRLRQERPQQVAAGVAALLPGDVLATLDESDRALAELFACADALALTRQQARNRIVAVASAATALGAVAQGAYASLARASWMLAYAGAVGLAYGLYLALFRLPWLRVEDRYLEYRALAEGLRVQLFWRLTGVQEGAAEHYLQLVRSEVGWVRQALRAVWLTLGAPKGTSEAAALVRQRWIEPEIAYFVGPDPAQPGGKALRCRRLQVRLERAANALLAAGALLVGFGILATLHGRFAWLKAFTIGYSTSLFVIAGVVKGYAAAMGYAEQADSFTKSGSVFRSALRVLQAQPERARECVLALGKHALAENADWLVKRRRNAYRVRR